MDTIDLEKINISNHMRRILFVVMMDLNDGVTDLEEIVATYRTASFSGSGKNKIVFAHDADGKPINISY